MTSEQIDILEKIISNSITKDDNFAISPKDIDFYRETLKKLIDPKTEINTYIPVSCSGFTTYALYKSSDSKIYMFTVYMNEEPHSCIQII